MPQFARFLTKLKDQQLLDLDGISLLDMIMGKQDRRAEPIMFWGFGKSMNRGKDKPYIDPKLQEGTTPLVKMLGGRFTRNFLNYHHPSIIEEDYAGSRTMIDGDHKLVIIMVAQLVMALEVLLMH